MMVILGISAVEVNDWLLVLYFVSWPLCQFIVVDLNLILIEEPHATLLGKIYHRHEFLNFVSVGGTRKTL